MTKKVLLICGSELCNAGVPNVIMKIVRGLQSSYTFDVLCLSEKYGEYDAEFSSYGGKIYRLPLPDYASNKVLYPIRAFKVEKELKRVLSQTTYDIIHCNCGIDSGICLMVSKRFGVPVRISHAHGTYSRKGKNYILRAYNYIQKQLIKQNATKLLACSSIAGDSLFSGAKYDNILNPVDVEIYRNVKKCSHDGINLLQIGYYCENKNQLFTLKVLEELLESGIEARVHFIGFASEQDYYDKIKKYVANNNLEKSVCFLCSNADKVKELSWADFSMLPSESEGLPLVALESQCANTICLMSDHIPKDSNIGYGLFLGYNNVTEWVKAIIDLKNTHQEEYELTVDVSTKCYLRKMEAAYERSW